jgi:3-deoxy-D-manno-octulosonic acid kinase
MDSLSARMVEEGCLDTGDGAILFDRRHGAQAKPDWLDPRHWHHGAESRRGGRGEVWFVRGPFGEAVLRHYRRGGLFGRLVRDRYLWTGAARTRAFREFRLMAELVGRGLPVPAPLMAGYRRFGAFYRADLLTARVPQARTLAQCLPQALADGELLDALGRTLGRFHAHGVCHADLNAHNLLLDGDRCWWLIDFDRGRLRAPSAGWQGRRLARLERSLLKLGAGRDTGWPAAWARLRAAHDAHRTAA